MKNPGNANRTRSMILRFLRGTWGYFVFCAVCAGFTALCDMLTPQIIRVTLDNVIPRSEEGLSAAAAWVLGLFGGAAGVPLWFPAALLLFVAALRVLSVYLFRVENAKGSQLFIEKMRTAVFDRLERLSVSWHMKNSTGDLLSRCTNDMETLRSFISEQLTNILRLALLISMSVGFMFSMDLRLALVAVLPMPVVFVYSFVFHNRVKKDFTVCDENEGKLSAIVSENLAGARLVRAYTGEGREYERLTAHNRYYTGLWVSLGKRLSRYWAFSDVIMGLQLLALILTGAYMCVSGSISSGEYVAFISYNAMLTWPVRQLGRLLTELSKAGVSAERVAYIYDSPELERSGGRDADLTGEIVFDNVSLDFDGRRVLDGVSFSVPPGSTLGVLGATGSGKSTLAMLLDGFYEPTEGKITISGVPLGDISLSCLRRGVAFVTQEPFLFSDTIAGNITMSPEEIGREAMLAAADAAQLTHAVAEFEKGFDTPVGEKGVTLSGGQRQRTAIARAVASKRRIYILDNALSAVDAKTDAAIRRNLAGELSGATVIIISHRISTLRDCDKIAVFDGGRLVSLGTHGELAAQPGLYRDVCAAQDALPASPGPGGKGAL
ncbi:MAG: ABC transporter ATP-binding protein/permease [Clostridia bacterium]|nr:ABC transporter ATP-binding protein/permease [Clostridia bacterium]